MASEITTAQRCGTCKAWDGEAADSAADCRKHAPVYVPGVQGGMWPTVARKDWCCEWEAK